VKASGFVFQEPAERRTTYAERIRGSAVFDEVSCAVTLGKITRDLLQEVYARIPWTEPVDPEAFAQLEEDVRKILFTIGYRPSSVAFDPQEVPADPSGAKYFEEAPISDYEKEYLLPPLRAMREPDLSEATEGSYRFLWVRAFDQPVSIRVIGPPAAATLIGKVLSGSPYRQPAKLCLRVERRLTVRQYETIRSCFSTPEIWQWPEEDPRRIKDGAVWVVEARQGGRHLFGRSWSPESGALRECALGLLEAAGIPTGEVY
jgi:hypothetical protein